MCLFFHHTHCTHAHFSPLTVTSAPINGSIIFTPSIRFPHARRAIRAGTGSSLAAAAMVAHFSDDRGRIQTRMVNGMLKISLSRARSVIYRSSIWCSISSRLYAFPYARLLPSPSTPKPKLPIRRSVVISSPPIFSLPGLAAPYTGTHSDQ